jgi:hypothetical protein
MNAKERLKRIIRAQNSLLKAKTHLQLAQNSIRKEYDLCVREAAAADGFVADCDERIERAGSWDGAQPDAYFGKLIKWRRCDRRDFGQLVRVSTQPVADPADMEKAVLIGLDYGPDGDISGYQCEGSKGQTVHWLAAWTEMKPGEELQAPPSGRKFTRIHIEGVDFGSVPQKWVPDQGKVGSCSGQGSANAHELNGRLWDVIADKWKIRPLDVVVLRPPAVWAKWPGWSALHDQILTNQRMVIDPEALAMVSPDGEIAIRILGFWVNVECFHVLAKDYHWEPTTFGKAMLANRPPAEPAKEAPEPITLDEFLRSIKPPEPAKPRESGPEVNAKDHFAGANKMVGDEPAKEAVDHLAVPRISPGEWLDIRDAYRDATPADVGKLVYVRNGELEPWIELRLAEVTGADFPYRCTKDGLDPSRWQAFRYACIRDEKPASSPIGEGYRHPMHIDLGEQCEFSDGSTNPDGSLVWGIFARLMLCKKDLESNAIRYYTEDGTYYHHCRVKVEG